MSTIPSYILSNMRVIGPQLLLLNCFDGKSTFQVSVWGSGNSSGPNAGKVAFPKLADTICKPVREVSSAPCLGYSCDPELAFNRVGLRIIGSKDRVWNEGLCQKLPLGGMTFLLIYLPSNLSFLLRSQPASFSNV